ncbi:MAG: maleylpyruvate isomerase family mycothiol-dependent enzyme [Actinomycetota bacterium]|nr:maleylpyruvate isomerase family mycothiol-dependent enzyme [Actinomycetota bacterium]
MEPYDLLAHLARDGNSFADACEAAGMATRVASCPEWNVSDLVWHLAEVHHFWRTIVGEQRTTWEGYEQPLRPTDDAVVEFYRSGLEETVTILAAAHPDQANWTWSHQRDAGFVMRRMAHETAMHLWDAQQAAGGERAIDGPLASDGIDEFLDHFLSGDAGTTDGVGGSVHLHCTDVPGEWTVRPAIEGGFTLSREHAKGDAAMRGAASDLLLVLWRRRPIDTIDVVGDRGVAERFVAHSPLD